MNDEMKKLKIMLFGQTGSGISSTANTILGTNEFKVSRSMRTRVETEIRSVNTRRYRRNIEVIPIPDLVSMDHKNKQLSTEILETWTPVRPDAALLVIRADWRYTKAQYDVYQGMKTKLNEKMAGCISNLFVVFTCGKMLDEEAFSKTSKEFCEVMKDALNRYVLLDNDATNAEKERQVFEILRCVDTTLSITDAEEKSTSPVPNFVRRFRGYFQDCKIHRLLAVPTCILMCVALFVYFMIIFLFKVLEFASNLL